MLINGMQLCGEDITQGTLSFPSEGARNKLSGHYPEIYHHLTRSLT